LDTHLSQGGVATTGVVCMPLSSKFFTESTSEKKLWKLVNIYWWYRQNTTA